MSKVFLITAYTFDRYADSDTPIRAYRNKEQAEDEIKRLTDEVATEAESDAQDGNHYDGFFIKEVEMWEEHD